MNIMIPNRHGYRLAVQVQGPDHAEPIIFLNALGTDHGMWQYQVAELEKDFRVLTFDTRGHGQSDAMETNSLQDMAEDVIDILDAFSIKKAHICGISIGGLIGLKLANIASDRLLSMTLANTAARIGCAEKWVNQAKTVERKGLTGIVNKMPRRWFSSGFDYKQDVVAQRSLGMLEKTSAQGFADACRALANNNLMPQQESIQLPCLIIAGAVDPLTRLKDVRDLHARIKHSRLCILDASHLSNIERPQAFFQIFRLFIRSI
ncbi:3-oxoadipate enol-lactonase [Acinetobacter calcoaceticus]|uniref:3-oxoadipate enol-lactonase n=1 Tax=Acinetobacter calcoaceticus TaxID=471 RepID=A0A4R1Y3L8_ACICA|nr:3-oxoadipate enol-lactonase [Acinetobacter calcoaceticus]